MLCYSFPNNHNIETHKASAIATSSISVTGRVPASILDIVVFSRKTALNSKRASKST